MFPANKISRKKKRIYGALLEWASHVEIILPCSPGLGNLCICFRTFTSSHIVTIENWQMSEKDKEENNSLEPFCLKTFLVGEEGRSHFGRRS